MPIVSSGGAGGAVSGVTVTGTAASGQVPVATSSSAGAWSYPPGFEINYTQITAPVNVVSTAEATGTTILSPGAITFDGSAVLLHFYTMGLTTDTAAAADTVIVSLFEGATQISRIAFAQTTVTASANSIGVNGFYRFTPSAASHTYTLTAFATSTTGTPKVLAGNGGTNGNAPAFVRFTKV